MPENVTFNTLHEDLKGGFVDLKQEVQTGFADLKGEVREGFSDLKAGIADLKVTLVAGFRNMPMREDSQEMIRLLRQRVRILKNRPAHLDGLDVRLQERSLKIQRVPRALAEETRRFKGRGNGVANV